MTLLPSLASFLFFQYVLKAVDSFSPMLSIHNHQQYNGNSISIKDNNHINILSTTKLYNKKSNIIDADFFPSNEDNAINPSPSSPTPTTTIGQKVSPLQASLSSVDPKLSSLSINFIDPSLKSSSRQSFIPCRLAFVVTYNDVEYVLGTPVDTQVAIYVEDSNTNSAYFLDTDEDENMEIMERAASVFEGKYKHISLSDEDDVYSDENDESRTRLRIRFKRTPRTLTVEGDLGLITGNWKEDERKEIDTIKKVGKEIVVNDMADENIISADDDYFDSFFTNELGSDYEKQAMKNPDVVDETGDEIMKLFNVPGLGTGQGDVEGMQSILEDIVQDEKNANENGMLRKGAETALRLVGFSDEKDDGKVYSLVQLLQPMILVAKFDPTLDLDERLLLTQEESDEVIPILEEQFRTEFETAGLSF